MASSQNPDFRRTQPPLWQPDTPPFAGAEGLSELGQAAVIYALSGFAVLPLRPGEKIPLLRGWTKKASTDPAVVARWWGINRQANIGLLTGKGFGVIDVDGRNGGKIDPAWPETLTVRTRSGGWHLYYRVEGEVRNSAGKLAPGIDVRGDGGMVVVPPSPGWEWANDLAMATIAAAVLRGDDGREEPPRLRAPSGGRLSTALTFRLPARAGEGERNSVLASFAGTLRWAGYEREGIEALLLAYNAAHCQPPLKDAEVLRIARSIARYER